MSPAMTNAAITLTSEVETVLGTLCDLLDRETTAVETSDFNVFRELQNDKFAILTRYRALLETMQHQLPMLKEADETVSGRLKKSAERFHVSAERNASALDRGQKSMQRIVDRIVRCARDTVHADRQSYNRSGQNGMTGQPVSIQVNEVL